jgi:hypothetical protein
MLRSELAIGLAQDLFLMFEICLVFFWVSPEILRMFEIFWESF